MKILVIDDDNSLRRTLHSSLEILGHQPVEARNSAEAIDILSRRPFDAALLDLRLGQEQGLDLLPRLLALAPGLSVVVLTAYATIETAVEAMRRGAFDYLPKPFTPEQLRLMLDRIGQIRRLQTHVEELEQQVRSVMPEVDLQTRVDIMKDVLDMAYRAAPTEATILIRGESGTGKGVLARSMHMQSCRKGGPFVTVHCPSLSAELLESELFGHVQGAFTGAVRDTVGKVATADGGTLFLDEIGDLPLALQPKLLRLLQERSYERVGETQTRVSNVRLLAATNRNLEAEIAAGRFREDLFYRLNVIEFTVPPLRERRDDILLLAEHLLRFFAKQNGKQIEGFTESAREALVNYPWPGNIRELRNAIERCVILSSSKLIEPGSLPATVAKNDHRAAQSPDAMSLEQLEAEHIRRMLAAAPTLEDAAEKLGIDPSTLYRKRKKFGIWMNFRRRIIVAILPLFALWVFSGIAGMAVIYFLSRQVGTILHENYDSVVYMRDLNEALERIDSSFQFDLTGKDASNQYKSNWNAYSASLKSEQGNVTLPHENELVANLTRLSGEYRRQGDAFFAYKGDGRAELYFGKNKKGGLYDAFQEIKRTSGDILRINEESMQQADRNSRRLARTVTLWYAFGIALAVVLAVVLAGRMIRNIAQPVKAVTESSVAIGAGNLDQLVPISSDDELGQLGTAFNNMARQLRQYRQSHQAQLLRAQQTSQATIDSFPDPVLVVDPEQVVEMANPAARRLLGVRPREEGSTLAGTWQPPEALRQPLIDALRKQVEYLPEGFDRAIVIQQGDEPRFYLPRILPIRDPQCATVGAAVLLEDITRFHLLDEVKSNLVATVSHELKTPLTSLRLVLHLLLEENVGPLLPKQLELVIDARDNAERLLAIINNLLDLTRLEEGGSLLHKRPIAPESLIMMVAEGFKPRAKDQGVDVEVVNGEGLPSVKVDVDRLQHALQNLLNNSLAHTPQGGRITLSAESIDGKVVFSVADTGTGIPPEHIEHIFEKYYRVPGDQTPGGSGLGLAIVREIAVAHGGSVECESVPGERTVFKLSLPVQ